MSTMVKFFKSGLFKTLATAIGAAAIAAVSPIVVPLIPSTLQPIVAGLLASAALHMRSPSQG